MNPETPTARSQITVHWIPELGDVTEFVQLTFVPRRMAIYFAVSSAVGLILTVGSWNYPAARTLAITLTVATIAALVWNLLVPRVVPQRLWAKKASALNPTICRIDADGITVEQEAVTSTHKWGAVKSAVETKKVFLLYGASNSSPTPILIPKRTMEPEDIALAHDLITGHVSRYRRHG